MNAYPDNRRIDRPRAIIFDWDNTLVDSWTILHDAINVALDAFGLAPWTLEQTRKRVRNSLRDSFPSLFGEHAKEAEKLFYDRFAEIHLDALRPCPGAGRMLEDLDEAGLYLGVVSNKKGDFLRREAAHLGWDRYFGQIIGAFDGSRDKPAFEPVDMALAGSGISRGQQVWFAGDADIDLECAANAGCVPVLVREQPPGSGEFDAFPPTWHFRECQELSKFIRRL